MPIATRNSHPSIYTLRRMIHAQLRRTGFSRNGSGYVIKGALTKQKIRKLHAIKRIEVIKQNRGFIEEYGSHLVQSFATGKQVDPKSIEPELVEVLPESKECHLFRFASLLWSVPVSQGFGRRIRFLVKDKQNGKLIGLFAIGDPVFNLSARDNWIGWTSADRENRLVHVMDAYVVGAVPPYSQLIGGKLVAALIASREVMDVYERKYIGHEGVISGKEKRARLVLITTTSAMGRSSLYNRLAIPNGPRFLRIGETKGFGHFHLSGLVFEQMRNYLESIGHPYAKGNRFGMGPNWKIRVARTTLVKIGFDPNAFLNHGIAREVYAVPLAENWKEILLGKQIRVRSTALPSTEISGFCLSRWIVPRASRDMSYKKFARCRIMEHLMNDRAKSSW